ncbi:granzyme H-like [Pelodiscus sinensis]|uniref:granzyme H-like n=1 Tax=Pelodiscus sinensis TaxID=13735 RepID=UPI003F6BBA68
MEVHFFFLLPMAFLLQPETWAWQIIGGHEAKPHSRPYMAYLRVRRATKHNQCGGFLVAENFVLTAAHCQGHSIHVTLGAHNIKQQEPSQQVIEVQRQIPHPQYNWETKINDIMLLQLQCKAESNGYVGLLSLPAAPQRVRPGTKCSVAGWGQMSASNEQISETLQEADVVVMPDADCRRKRGGPWRNYNATTMMCVGNPEEGRSPFYGDSGGPLVCGEEAQGIVSLGSEDGIPPAVYTKVSTFLPWIQETMKKLES